MNTLEKISKTIDSCVRYFIGTVLFAMFSLVVLQVLLRYIFKSPLAWTDELSRYLMTWMIFIGSCVASRECSHLGVTILYDKLSKNPKIFLLFIINICVCVFLILVALQSYYLLDTVKNATSPALQISMALPYISVPIGCLLMCFQTIAATIKIYHSRHSDI